MPGEATVIRRPTVIPSGGGSIKPTVMGVCPQGQATKPTAIPGTPGKVENLKPTAIPSNTVQAVVKPAIVPVGKPSVIGIGEVRKRIPITSANLQGKTQKVETIERVVHLVESFIAERATEQSAVMWGTEVQKQYSGLMSEVLALSRSETLNQVSRRVGRLIEILGSIKLDKVFAQKGGEGFLARAIKKSSAEVDSLEELERALEEIDQIAKIISDDVPKLLALRGQIELISTRTLEVGDEVNALALAGAHIAEHLESIGKRDVAGRLSGRVVSLTATTAEIVGGSSVRKLQIEQPLQLIEVAQDLALVTVPTMLNSLAALQLLARRGNKPSVTQVSEVGDLVSAVIGKLRSA